MEGELRQLTGVVVHLILWGLVNRKRKRNRMRGGWCVTLTLVRQAIDSTNGQCAHSLTIHDAVLCGWELSKKIPVAERGLVDLCSQSERG
jgi:hypothetical protein